jgi:hypothetical protein
MAGAYRSVDLYMCFARHGIADDGGHVTLVVAHRNFNQEAVPNDRVLGLGIER